MKQVFLAVIIPLCSSSAFSGSDGKQNPHPSFCANIYFKSFSEADMKLLPSKSVKSLNVTDFLVELQQLIDRLIISYVIFRAQIQTFDGFGFSDVKICCLSDMRVNWISYHFRLLVRQNEQIKRHVASEKLFIDEMSDRYTEKTIRRWIDDENND